MTKALILDVETTSVTDLRTAGAWRYVEDPATTALCIGWGYAGGPSSGVWNAVNGSEPPPALVAALMSAELFVAHHAMFEWAVFDVVLPRQHPTWAAAWRRVNPDVLHDTMLKCAYWGLPQALEEAAGVLGLRYQKDKDGHALMMRMARPRGFFHGKPVWWHAADPAKLLDLMNYCRADVEAERELWTLLPDIVRKEVWRWRQDLHTQRRGVSLDRPFIDRLHAVAGHTLRDLDLTMSELTGGEVTSCNQVARLLAWLRSQGLNIRSVAAEDVAFWVDAPGLPNEINAVLKVRAEAARSSTRKLKAMQAVVCRDGTAKGMTQFYGAGRTGRYGGRLVQVQNLPRGAKDFPKKLIDLMALQPSADSLMDVIEKFSPVSVLKTISASLRGCIVAAHGRKLVVMDLAQIEARVGAWLAGQKDVLEVFSRGEDVYAYTAAKFGSKDRQAGKVAALGLGFGMGYVRFIEHARSYGVALSAPEAELIVREWRLANYCICDCWKLLKRAFVRCVENVERVRVKAPGSPAVVEYRPTKFNGQPSVLCLLPSGRELTYYKVRFTDHPTWPDAYQITYEGVDQNTRQWVPTKTWGGKLFENIVQALARDVMMDGVDRVENPASGLRLLMTVHDEVVADADEKDEEALDRLNAIMTDTADWCRGLPVAAEGWEGKRYQKG